MKTNYKNLKLQNDKIIIYILFAIIFLGSLLGSIFANYTNLEDTEKMALFMDSILNSKNENTSFNIVYFLEIFLKNFKYFIGIWFLGFISFGNLFILFIIFIKGFSIGFTSTIFINKYAFSGINYILQTYTMVNIIFIPLFIYIVFKAMQYYKNKDKNKFNIYMKDIIIITIINIIISIIQSI